MSNIFPSLARSAAFAFWSLRRRVSQIVPVAAALLLLVCAVQVIGALHDISSVLTQQQIARSWRGPYDLLVRPQSAVSQPERTAGWIDPQSNLETYGGIGTRQIASIQSLRHVVQVVPFTTAGWQTVEVLLPVELPQIGIYRISATWNGQWQTNDDTIRYVDVTDLTHLTTEIPITHPIVQHIIAGQMPIVFTMSVQATQAVIGVPISQLANLREELLKGISPAPALHPSLRVERLNGGLNILPSCIKPTGQSNCWQVEPVRQGPVSYVADGVQLIHYSRTIYSASSQQLATGQVSMNAPGNDVQGPIYRLSLPGSLDTSAQANRANLSFEQLSSPALIPFSAPEHLPLLTNAVRFVPLEQVCTPNIGNCYSGLYIRLSDVDHYSQQSLSLLQATAAAITTQTGLHVDILDGSSWRSVSVEFPQAGVTSTQQSSWRVPGVAVQIVQGVDGLQEMLLVLCSIVCLLAIGSAGVLVGVGRRKDALLLRQLGWQNYMLITVFILDALLLCTPACLLIIGWLTLATNLWLTSLPSILLWILPTIGVILYSCLLVRAALGGVKKMRNHNPNKDKFLGKFSMDVEAGVAGTGTGPLAGALGPPHHTPVGSRRSHMVGATLAVAPGWVGALGRAVPVCWVTTLRRIATLPNIRDTLTHLSPASRTKLIGLFICGLATTCAVFLIAEGYILMTNFNSVLVVTILGKQVSEALEGPQLALLLVIVAAALLTVALCTRLLLLGRREELRLLSMIGWERRATLLRIMGDSSWPALLSGAVGTLLALGLATLIAVLPSLLVVLILLLCGPLIGIALVSIATIGIAWQETGRVYVWR